MLQLIATSTTGLESVVSKELKQLGYSPKNSDVSFGQTYFEGEWKDVVKANLWLRSAGKILVKLTEFDVRDDFDVIFDARYLGRIWLRKTLLFSYKQDRLNRQSQVSLPCKEQSRRQS